MKCLQNHLCLKQGVSSSSGVRSLVWPVNLWMQGTLSSSLKPEMDISEGGPPVKPI